MTTKPSQRTPEFWERVAREYCRSTGIDPDGRVMLPGGAAAAPNWKKPAAEIKRLLLLAEAYDTVEDLVEDEEREAKFGPWLPVPADGSAPPLPAGRDFEVRRRDGDDEFYAAGSFGPSRWGGDDDWSLVEYRVERHFAEEPHPRKPIPVEDSCRNWGPWHTFKPGPPPMTPPGCDVELMFASGHTRVVPAKSVAKCWSSTVEAYRVEWPEPAEIPSVCDECGTSFGGKACPKCDDRVVWSGWLPPPASRTPVEPVDIEVEYHSGWRVPIPSGTPIRWDEVRAYRYGIAQE